MKFTRILTYVILTALTLGAVTVVAYGSTWLLCDRAWKRRPW